MDSLHSTMELGRITHFIPLEKLWAKNIFEASSLSDMLWFWARTSSWSLTMRGDEEKELGVEEPTQNNKDYVGKTHSEHHILQWKDWNLFL